MAHLTKKVVNAWIHRPTDGHDFVKRYFFGKREKNPLRQAKKKSVSVDVPKWIRKLGPIFI